MSLPRLLIIGAMKAGTTSLYMDVASHRGAFLAQEKEPQALCHDSVFTPEGLAAYQDVYAGAPADALCCDASTGYAKRPDYEGVPERALQVLPDDFRVVYVVRNPISRIVSQHHHEYYQGMVGPSIDEEIRRHPRYIQYSRYGYQLAPWIQAVGRARVRVVSFERYVASREETLRELFEFLGLSCDEEVLRRGKVYNRSQGKPVKNEYWQKVKNSKVYRRHIRPLAPLKLRLTLQEWLLPKATETLAPPSAETLDCMTTQLKDDLSTFGALLTPAELTALGPSLAVDATVSRDSK